MMEARTAEVGIGTAPRHGGCGLLRRASARLLGLPIELCERRLVPDPVVRFGMRRLMASRLREERQGGEALVIQRFRQRIEELGESPLAVDTASANEQHYELPAEFFEAVLGPHLKYSCAWWDESTPDLGAAELRMLEKTAERAELADGQRILELGCGWGSLSLWMAARFPNARITALSNSGSQRRHIEARAAERGLDNLAVITADINEFDTDARFDRVVSVEMFEHVRNYEGLMSRIAGWLHRDGKLFVHHFCHREFMYPFTVDGRADWMARHFFTGGLMPAERTLQCFQEHLRVERQWRVPGHHYQRTANAWLERLDRKRDLVIPILRDVPRVGDATLAFNRWRMFFMACAELFGYHGGREWSVVHFRFVR